MNAFMDILFVMIYRLRAQRKSKVVSIFNRVSGSPKLSNSAVTEVHQNGIVEENSVVEKKLQQLEKENQELIRKLGGELN